MTSWKFIYYRNDEWTKLFLWVDKITRWHNDHLTKWQNDKMTNSPNDSLNKWLVEQMTVTYWLVDKMTNSPNDELTKWQIHQMTSWQNDKFTKWRVDRMMRHLHFCFKKGFLEWKSRNSKQDIEQTRRNGAMTFIKMTHWRMTFGLVALHRMTGKWQTLERSIIGYIKLSWADFLTMMVCLESLGYMPFCWMSQRTKRRFYF